MSELTPSITTSATRKPRTRRKWALALVAILSLVFLHWLLFQGLEVVPGVISRPLGPCDISVFEKKGGAIVLGCPHADLIRLWPLPALQPWWEDLPARQGESVAYAKQGQTPDP